MSQHPRSPQPGHSHSFTNLPRYLGKVVIRFQTNTHPNTGSTLALPPKCGELLSLLLAWHAFPACWDDGATSRPRACLMRIPMSFSSLPLHLLPTWLTTRITSVGKRQTRVSFLSFFFLSAPSFSFFSFLLFLFSSLFSGCFSRLVSSRAFCASFVGLGSHDSPMTTTTPPAAFVIFTSNPACFVSVGILLIFCFLCDPQD